MKTMIWKELRENVKWAVLAFLGLLFVEIYALSSAGGPSNNVSGFGLCSSAFLMVSAFGCSVIGAALGIVQILPELRRDQWAALLHRPVPRGVIFYGKAIPGLALYFLATILPLLASVCYVAIPRNLPCPFVPGMMIPSLSDLLLGVVFYFAALLTCLHRGRWFGTKGVIMLAVLPVFLLHVTAGNSLVVLPVVASLILMLAAWGALLGNGPIRSMPVLGRVSYALVALAGIQTALMLAAVCLDLVPRKTDQGVMIYCPRFEVAQDGQVFDRKESGDDLGELIDMNGKPVTDERYVGNDSQENLCDFLSFEADLKGEALSQDVWLRSHRRDARNYAMEVQGSYYDAEYWYILVHENYLVGYDKLSRRRVGFFDREGFKSPGNKPAPFPSFLWMSDYSGDNPLLFISGSRVYAFDFPERSMKIFCDAGKGAICSVVKFGNGYASRNLVAVALENEIRILDPTGKPLGAIPYPHDPERWGYLSISANKTMDRIYLQSQDTGLSSLPDFLDEFDLQGHLLQAYSRPVPTEPASASRWEDRLIEYSAPLGPILMMRLHGRFDLLGSSEMTPQIPSYYAYGQPGVLAGIALALAAVTFLWARNYGFSTGAAVGWGAFAFVFGPAGVLTFRLATDWPVRIRCPACGKKRAIEGERCPRCGHSWTLPEGDGTEILDAAGRGEV